ncbi:MAG: DUF4198 domain-containing protein [archaeon]|nr:DUF4198 domain-containing protein [archaeon]
MKTNPLAIDEETMRSCTRQVYGHEMWIQDIRCEDGEFTAHGLYGHKMLPDKPMPTDYANVVLYDDDGRVADPEREIVNRPRGWRFIFPDEGADVYTLYIDSNSVWVTNDEGWHRGGKRDYSGVTHSEAFNMAAKRLISRDGVSVGNVMHLELEIVPEKATLKVGEKANFTVFYEGVPIKGVKIIAYHPAWQDLMFLKTDAEGKVSFDVKDVGTYAVIAKYTDEEKCSEDFDETGFSTTLTIDAE